MTNGSAGSPLCHRIARAGYGIELDWSWVLEYVCNGSDFSGVKVPGLRGVSLGSFDTSEVYVHGCIGVKVVYTYILESREYIVHIDENTKIHPRRQLL